jgi:two-component system, probable response regulator PhcQ
MNNRKNTILFVDDEEKTLKYFEKVFCSDYEILTAENAERAWKILEERKGNVTVLLSDQRMPGQSGVELLSAVREHYPSVIRILTTAYSDIDSAIDSVNEGAIYQYIVKPWNIKELRLILKRTVEYALIQGERDMLLRQKMSVLQRLVIVNRAQGLSILAVALEPKIKNPLAALSCYVGMLTENKINQSLDFGQGRFQDMAELMQIEGNLMQKVAKQVMQTLLLSDLENYEQNKLSDIILPLTSQKIQEQENELAFKVHLNSALPCINVVKSMMQKALDALIETMVVCCFPKDFMRLNAEKCLDYDQEMVRISIMIENKSWTDEQTSLLFAILKQTEKVDISLNLLIACFIIYHHKGRLSLRSDCDIGFDVLIPVNPEQAEDPPFNENFLQKLFSHFEAWDNFL